MIFLPIGLVSLSPCVIYGFIQFDKLAAFEVDNYPQEWLRDGAPNGFFRQIPDGSSWERTFCIGTWLLCAPNWIKRHAETRAWLHRMRVCVLVWIIGLVLALLLDVATGGIPLKSTPKPVHPSILEPL